MQPIISIHSWVSIPNEVRYRIRSIFHIPRSSNTVVSDGVVETDGVTNEDLKNLTVLKMQAYLQSESTDFHKLFDLVLARVNDELQGKAPAPKQNEAVTVIIEPTPKKRTTKKNANVK